MQRVVHIRDLVYILHVNTIAQPRLLKNGVAYREVGVNIWIGAPHSAEKCHPPSLEYMINHRTLRLRDKLMFGTHGLTIVVYSGEWCKRRKDGR